MTDPRARAALAAALALLAAGCGDDDRGRRAATATAAPAASATATAGSTATPTVPAPATATRTASALATATRTVAPTDTSTPTATLVPSATATPTEGPLDLLPLAAVPDSERGGWIVDAAGRHVILRGVNVNALVEYWQGSEFPTVFPVGDADAALMAETGWNAVRLLLSWSRVEPEPGVYDDAYLEEVRAHVRRFAARGLYSIVDLHQDAWSATLAAPPGTMCEANSEPAFGWDGAPAWATLDGGQSRCAPLGVRELSPAVRAAFASFFADAPGPGGIGIRARYAAMLGHVAEVLAGEPGVAGYDLMNEPNAFGPEESAGLAALYAEAIAAIRAGEQAAGAPARLVFFEPSAVWSLAGGGAPPPSAHDDQVVYAPHIYSGSIIPRPLAPADFETARAEAAMFGGAPVLVGEWGGDPRRAADPADTYFARHQELQDEFLFGATLWTWRESCGDPHKMGDIRAGRVPYVWGEFEVDCTTNTVTGLRTPLLEQLTRAYVRAAPGRLTTMSYEPASGAFTAAGEDAVAGQRLVAFYPAARHGEPELTTAGLEAVEIVVTPGDNVYLLARAAGGSWSLEAQ